MQPGGRYGRDVRNPRGFVAGADLAGVNGRSMRWPSGPRSSDATRTRDFTDDILLSDSNRRMRSSRSRDNWAIASQMDSIDFRNPL